MELGEPVGSDLHGRFNELLARPQTCIFTLDSVCYVCSMSDLTTTYCTYSGIVTLNLQLM
jgi:hypothetical protein